MFELKKLFMAEEGGEGGAPAGGDSGESVDSGNDGSPNTPPEGGSSESWLSSVSEDNRNGLDKFKSVDDLAKSYKSLESQQGNSLRIPSDEASDEDRKAFAEKLLERVPNVMLKPNFDDSEQAKEFYRALGTPEKPDDYKYEGVEGVEISPEREQMLRQLAIDNNLTGKQFDSIITSVLKSDAETIQQQNQAHEEAVSSLKQEWGAAYDKNVDIAKDVANQFFPQFEGQVPVDLMPGLVKLASQFDSDGNNFGGQSSNNNQMTPEEASSQISEIMSNSKHPYWNPSDPGHEAAKTKLVNLHKMRSGEKV